MQYTKDLGKGNDFLSYLAKLKDLIQFSGEICATPGGYK